MCFFETKAIDFIFAIMHVIDAFFMDCIQKGDF